MRAENLFLRSELQESREALRKDANDNLSLWEALEKEKETSCFYKEDLTKPLFRQFNIFWKHTKVQANAKIFKRPRTGWISFFLYNIFLSFISKKVIVNLNFMFLFAENFIPHKSWFKFLEL